MAKAPSTAAAFDGSGTVWFKILDIGPKFPGGTWDLRRLFPSPPSNVLLTGSRNLHVQPPKLHHIWRISPSHPTTSHPQPRRRTTVLHRMCPDRSNRRWIEGSWTQGCHSWGLQGHGPRIYGKYLQQLQQLYRPRPSCGHLLVQFLDSQYWWITKRNCKKVIFFR